MFVDYSVHYDIETEMIFKLRDVIWLNEVHKDVHILQS
jgi:hypothetical protein